MSIFLWTRDSPILYLILSFAKIQGEHFSRESKAVENDVTHNKERRLSEIDCHMTS